MKKIVSLMLIFCMLMCSSGIISAAKSNVSIQGYKINAADVQEVFSSWELTDSVQSVSLDIDDCDIAEDNIVISGTVNDQNQKTTVLFEGKMFISGYKQNKKKVESYVGALSENNSKYEVLYFEIKNSTKEDDVLFSEKLKTKKCFILYLRDKEGNVFAFQEKLNKLGINASDLKCTEVAEGVNDKYWFVKALEPEKSEIPFEPSMFPELDSDTANKLKQATISESKMINTLRSSSNGYYNVATPVLRYSYDYGYVTYEFMAFTYFEGYINDVPNTGTTEWTSSLRIVQSARENGVINNDHNAHFFKLQGSSQSNGRIQCTVAAGDNTRMQSLRLGYQLLQGSNRNYGGAVWSVLGMVAESDPYTRYAYQILNIASSLFGELEAKLIQQDANSSLEQDCAVMRYELSNSNTYLCCSSNRLELFITVLTADNTQIRNESTVAAVNWKYAVKFSGNSSTVTEYNVQCAYVPYDTNR